MTVNTGEKPTSVAAIEPKMALTGVVQKVTLFGAFVDIGLEYNGLIHISQLSSKPVRNVTDVVKESDEVTAWVLSVDPDKHLVNLTLVQPPAVTWDEIKQGDVVTGKVTRVEKYGAFVDIGAERQGRIHVSELADEYVKDPADVVKVGEEIQVKVISVNPRKRQIDLSLKAMSDSAPATSSSRKAQQRVEEDPQEDPQMPTAMELAFRRAMEGTDMGEAFERRAQQAKKQRKASRRSQQEDILSRTLQTRKK